MTTPKPLPDPECPACSAYRRAGNVVHYCSECKEGEAVNPATPEPFQNQFSGTDDAYAHPGCPGCADRDAKIAALKARVEALEKALAEFGKHHPSCPLHPREREPITTDEICMCGFEAALRAGGGGAGDEWIEPIGKGARLMEMPMEQSRIAEIASLREELRIAEEALEKISHWWTWKNIFCGGDESRGQIAESALNKIRDGKGAHDAG